MWPTWLPRQLSLKRDSQFLSLKAPILTWKRSKKSWCPAFHTIKSLETKILNLSFSHKWGSKIRSSSSLNKRLIKCLEALTKTEPLYLMLPLISTLSKMFPAPQKTSKSPLKKAREVDNHRGTPTITHVWVEIIVLMKPTRCQQWRSLSPLPPRSNQLLLRRRVQWLWSQMNYRIWAWVDSQFLILR